MGIEGNGLVQTNSPFSMTQTSCNIGKATLKNLKTYGHMVIMLS
jgi:hypothetical protein